MQLVAVDEVFAMSDEVSLKKRKDLPAPFLISPSIIHGVILKANKSIYQAQH